MNQLNLFVCDLIHLVLQSGTFFDLCKAAKVILIYKKGDALECNNHCPITYSKINRKTHPCQIEYISGNEQLPL